MKKTTQFHLASYKSPIGCIQIKSNNDKLISLHFSENPGEDDNKLPEIIVKTIAQLNEYFLGRRKQFDLELHPIGTEFQKQVWSEIQSIRYGQTASYIEIAKALGSERLSRAVGMANSKNLLPIVIPCHRVIGANGKLIGYAGGLERKKWLLQHELNYSEDNQLLF